MSMFGRRKKGPDKPFSHAEGCQLLAADAAASIPWQEVERGHWRAVWQCGAEDYYEPVGDRVRLDPLDAKTSRHLPQCEFAAATDPTVLRVLLKVTPGLGGYHWVTCGACDAGWQVPHFAESVG